MNHIYLEGNNKQSPTLILLHGTGGNERDLLQLAEIIAPDAGVLGIRGNVLENGMPRFFRRLAEGVFDIEDLIFRTHELNAFITTASEQYGFDRKRTVAIGYSNGANIAASLLYHDAAALSGAILFHAMVPIRGIELPDLTGIPVFIGAGKHDRMIPAEHTKELAADLSSAGASVTEYWTSLGHQLTHDEIDQAKSWFDQQFGQRTS